jgi:pyruvate ferredoxin oxidoreductase alpha subunit
MEFRYQMYEAMQQAIVTAQEADDEFGEFFGRRYGLLDAYHCEDAELVLVAAGSMAGTVRDVVDDRRALGEKIGLLKIRFLRPFPTAEVRRALANAKTVAVIDRNMSVGLGGILCNEIRAALQPKSERKTVLSFIAGLGGRDVTPDSIRQVIELTHTHTDNDQPIWIDLKE